MPLRLTLALIPLLLLLGGCASGPKFVTEGVDTDLIPTQASAEAPLHRGKKVLWGGTIINSTNLEEQTRLELLAYPLDSDYRPQTNQPPYGRFLLLHEGYLETVDYAPGRQVSVIGRFDGTRTGRLDQTEYTYPVVLAEQLHLWPQQGRDSGGTRFHFGIGVLFSN